MSRKQIEFILRLERVALGSAVGGGPALCCARFLYGTRRGQFDYRRTGAALKNLVYRPR